METPIDDTSLQELKDFFAQINLPQQVDLYTGTRIMDISKFLKTQFNIVENGSIVVRRPAFERLIKLRDLLTTMKITPSSI